MLPFQRVALIGLGLIEAIPVADILAAAQQKQG